jgi:hypothetical protein
VLTKQQRHIQVVTMSLSLPIFRNSKTTKVIRLSRNPSKTHQKMRARKESPTVLSKAAMSQEASTRPRSPAERPKQSQLSMGHAKRTIEKNLQCVLQTHQHQGSQATLADWQMFPFHLKVC